MEEAVFCLDERLLVTYQQRFRERSSHGFKIYITLLNIIVNAFLIEYSSKSVDNNYYYHHSLLNAKLKMQLFSV